MRWSHGIGQNSQPPRKLSQLMLYPAPARLAEKTVILEVPVFVSFGASTFEHHFAKPQIPRFTAQGSGARVEE